jgi:hypothetical protein
MTLRERVLASELKTGTVNVPEWGGEVGIREMSVEQRVKFAMDFMKAPALTTASMVIDNTFDPETGKPVFEKTDRDTLIKKGGKPVQALSDAIIDLSGMSPKAEAELEKN